MRVNHCTVSLLTPFPGTLLIELAVEGSPYLVALNMESRAGEHTNSETTFSNIAKFINHLQYNPQKSMRVYLRVLGHMALDAYITHARLHLCGG